MLVDILNRYLRPYVKRLDPSQIKVGVWKGEGLPLLSYCTTLINTHTTQAMLRAIHVAIKL